MLMGVCIVHIDITGSSAGDAVVVDTWKVIVHTVVIIADIADVVVVVVHACWIFCSEGRRCCYYCSTAVVDLLLLRILYCCILLYPTLLVPCLSMVLFPYIGFDGNDAPNIK
mmetsp:Transcript_10271/g.9924  ORF Transcript_10271/g.9924 Transcript_10271/m.9924 type:complete len:112 (-) Transcript_10271:101-436(-)